MDIVEALYPDYKAAMDKITNQVIEFSKAIGFGADGLSHLIQATQSGVSVLGGVLKKDEDWLRFKIAEKALDTTKLISDYAEIIQTDPGRALTEIFMTTTFYNNNEVRDWWNNTSSWIKTTSDNAIKAVKGLNDVVINLQKFENEMPAFIRDHIPAFISAGLDNINTTIASTILPTFYNINKTLSEYNAAISQQRKKASELAYELAHPGYILKGVDNLEESEKRHQEDLIDDIASRKYNEDTDKYAEDDKALINELDKTSALFEAGISSLPFMSLEDNLPGTNPVIIKEPFETWFVDGYKSQY